jgi:hypothetical protein
MNRQRCQIHIELVNFLTIQFGDSFSKFPRKIKSQNIETVKTVVPVYIFRPMLKVGVGKAVNYVLSANIQGPILRSNTRLLQSSKICRYLVHKEKITFLSYAYFVYLNFLKCHQCHHSFNRCLTAINRKDSHRRDILNHNRHRFPPPPCDNNFSSSFLCK